ncbi:MAG: hypothetical protein AAGF99_15310 [Bacteroidota bacterium]
MRLLPFVPIAAAALFASAALLASAAAVAQPLTFGHAADPLEVPQQRTFGTVAQSEIALLAGPSFIDDRWRAFGGVEARLVTGRLGAGVLVPGRTGVTGVYQEDYDEPYDALRRLLHLRLNPTPTSPLYLRLGPIEHLRLGTGHLLDGFATTAAWEERTLGVEAAARVGAVSLAGFLEDVRLNGLVGGQVAVRPLRRLPGAFGRLQLTLEGTYDLTTAELRASAPADSVALPLALGATLQAPLRGEVFTVGPYATGAYQWERGGSAEIGLEAMAVRFADLVDLHARLGLYGFESGVRVAPFDAFYPLTRRGEIVQADPFFETPGRPRTPARFAADSIEAGGGLLFDVQIRLGESLLLAQTLRLPTDGQPLGAHRLRAAYATSQGLRFVFAFERGGVRKLSDIVQGFDADLTTLRFDVDYPVTRRIVARMRARYGFRRLPSDPLALPDAYLVERRFEPMVGLRYRF